MHIGIISSTFGDAKESHSSHALAQYTLLLATHLRTHLGNATDLTVLSTIEKQSGAAPAPMRIQGINIQPTFRRTPLDFPAIVRAVRRGRFDVVHIQHETFAFGGPISIALAPLLFAILRFFAPIVVTLHHVVDPAHITRDFAQMMHHPRIPFWTIRLGFRLFYRLTGIAASAIVVHEESFRTILVETYGLPSHKVFAIPHGIQDPTADVSRDRVSLLRQFGLPEDSKNVFGFFGYIQRHKGIESLINEFALHAHSHPQDTLIIAGHERHPYRALDTEYLDSLKNLARTAVPGRIKWHGPVEDEQVGQYFALIDCLVLPYKACVAQSGPLSYAIGSLTPFLASSTMSALVRDPSFLFEPVPGGLASAMSALAERTPEQRETLKKSLLGLREKRNWIQVAKATGALYGTLHHARSYRAKIMLVGAFGQDNLGDELLLEQCLSRLPREQCVVASSQPTRTIMQHGVRSIHSHGKLARQLITFLRAHTVVVGGGDQLKLLKKVMGAPSHSLLFRCFLLALLSRIVGKKLHFVAIGIGNISGSAARHLAQWILRLSTTTLLRDQKSYRTARELAPRAHILPGADLAFLSAQNSADTAHTARATQTGVAPCVHLDQADAYTTVTQELAKGIDTLLHAQAQTQIIFLPFQTGFAHHHDIIVSREIIAQTHHPERCAIEEQLDLTSVRQVYASLGTLWGMRLHSLILACLYHVPFIALIYDVKVRKFLEEIDCAEWGIPLDTSFSAEKLLVLHRRMESRLPELREHLRKQAEKLAARAEVNARLLSRIAQEVAGQRVSEHLWSPDECDPCHLPPLS